MKTQLKKTFNSMYELNLWLQDNEEAHVLHLIDIRGVLTLTYRLLTKEFDWTGYSS